MSALRPDACPAGRVNAEPPYEVFARIRVVRVGIAGIVLCIERIACIDFGFLGVSVRIGRRRMLLIIGRTLAVLAETLIRKRLTRCRKG